MADVRIGYVGRGEYGERTFRVQVSDGYYDDVLGEGLDVRRATDAPAHKLLRYADTEVPVETGYTYEGGESVVQTMPYWIIGVISDTKDPLNFDLIGINEYGFVQRNPNIAAEPSGERLVPKAANLQHVADEVPQAGEMLPAEEFFSRHGEEAEDFTTASVPAAVQKKLRTLQHRAEKAEQTIARVREVVGE